MLLRFHPAADAVKVGDLRQPAAHMIVAQPARSFLEVGLEVKNRAAVLLVPPARHPCKIAHQLFAITRHQLRHDLVMKTHEQALIARQVPAVEQRNAELEVIGLKAATIAKRASGVSDPKPKVPEGPCQGCNGFAQAGISAGIRAGPLGKEEKVDIRMGEKLLSSVASHGCEAEALRSLQVLR